MAKSDIVDSTTNDALLQKSVSILDRRDHQESSIFLPANLLREARRQRNLPSGNVPSICLLDPDGDLIRYLDRCSRAPRSKTWACYHTEMVEMELDGNAVGIVGCAVGAPFAVLVAEQAFASGCKLLISLTSAGRIADDLPASCIVVIDRALRGEGTSQAYVPPAPWIDADSTIIDAVQSDLQRAGITTRRGITWTTDAPFRETASALAVAADLGAIAVEMESAALYAFAHATNNPVVCLAHVTNELAINEGDFEKGPDSGAHTAIAIASAIASGWHHRTGEEQK